jgi:hypothetical protein
VVWDARKPDGTEIDRIGVGQLREPVVGHHPAGREVVLARPRVLRGLDSEPVGDIASAAQDAEAFRYDLLTYPVSSNDRDVQRLHR